MISTYYLSGVVAATDVNDRSSRSHAIFTVTVEGCVLGADKQQIVRTGKLHLVDLAVSWSGGAHAGAYVITLFHLHVPPRGLSVSIRLGPHMRG